MPSSDKLENLAVKLFDIDAVKFGDFEAKVGRRTPIYFDLRVLGSYPDVLDELDLLTSVTQAMPSTEITVSELLQELSSDIEHELICGVPYAALPIATVMSANTLTPMLMKRKETKVYGTKKILEGVYREKQKCLIVEDVVTSGGSLMETVETLRAHGLRACDAVVVLDRGQGGAAVLETSNVKMKSLLTLNKLVKILYKANKIDASTVKIVLDHINECQFDGNGGKDNYFD